MAPANHSRRDLLAATTTAIAVTGCLDGDDPGTSTPTATTEATATATDAPPTTSARATETADPTETADTTERQTDVPVDEEAAAASIGHARDAIQSAFDELAASETDHGTLRNHVGTAAAALDNAEPRATEEQRPRITDLRSVTSYLATLTEADAALASGLADLQTGLDAYWRARDHYFEGDHSTDTFEAAATDFDDAATAYEATATQFDDARRTYREARDELQGLDGTVVSSFEGVVYQRQQNNLTGGIQIAAALTVFTLGHATGAVAWIHTSNGLAATAIEDWDAADTAFADARDQFQTATTHYDDTDTDRLYAVLPFLEDWYAPVICETDGGVEMLEHFTAAIDAARDGDSDTYEAEIAAGHEVHTDCHN